MPASPVSDGGRTTTISYKSLDRRIYSLLSAAYLLPLFVLMLRPSPKKPNPVPVTETFLSCQQSMTGIERHCPGMDNNETA
jgi:hypothetical protein